MTLWVLVYLQAFMFTNPIKAKKVLYFSIVFTCNLIANVLLNHNNKNTDRINNSSKKLTLYLSVLTKERARSNPFHCAKG